MPLTIRCTTDAALVHRLTQVAFAEYGLEAGTSTALRETPEAIATQLSEGNRALIAFLKDQPVACVRYRLENDSLYFFRLSVDPTYRRQGLASALTRHLETLALDAGLSRLTCSVRLAKSDNIALYTGQGFQLINTRTVYRDGIEVATGDLVKPLPHPEGTRPSPKGKGELTEREASAGAGLPDGAGTVNPPFPLGEGVRGRGQQRVVTGQRVIEGKVLRAREFRDNPTPSEAILWERLRANRLHGLKFRRQQIIAGFIVDFYCHAAALAVELDGSVHDSPERDAERDAILFGKGIRVIRFPNDAIENNLEQVLSLIAQAAKSQVPPSL